MKLLDMMGYVDKERPLERLANPGVKAAPDKNKRSFFDLQVSDAEIEALQTDLDRNQRLSQFSTVFPKSAAY
jgi:hypothetical protein